MLRSIEVTCCEDTQTRTAKALRIFTGGVPRSQVYWHAQFWAAILPASAELRPINTTAPPRVTQLFASPLKNHVLCYLLRHRY